jgi:hypothetical protein
VILPDWPVLIALGVVCLIAAQEDMISSFKFKYRSTCPSSPEL